MVNQFLTELDGVGGRVGVCVLAASSRPDLIDPALLRPGRLDKVLYSLSSFPRLSLFPVISRFFLFSLFFSFICQSIYCGLPNSDDRHEILKAVSRKMNLDPKVDLRDISRRAEGYTGADLQALLYNAQIEAVHDVIDAGRRDDRREGAPVVTMDHVERSYATTRPSLSKKEIARLEGIYEAFGSHGKERKETTEKPQHVTLA